MIEALFVAVGVILAVFLLTAFIGAPYVPSHTRQVRKAFRALRPLHGKDVLVDIGSGDGVVLREALRGGAGKVIGYEINPFLVVVAKLRLYKSGANSEVKLANFWHVSFPPEVTVVYTFGESRDIAKMYKKVEQEATRLDREIDFISYAFAVPGRACKTHRGSHYLYRVTPLQPAKT